jgi:bifunctional ADP-heptose synthase (sugar kinase/adenylyltransferase)
VRSLAALACVDYVIVIPHVAAVEAIECVQPNVYCKGKEYEDPSVDVTGDILDDISTVERLGGQVAYVGSVVFSSTRLLNQNFDTYASNVSDFCKGVAQGTSATSFREAVDSFSSLKVLVVGDIIFDRYTTVQVQGLTSKNRILSGRYIEDDLQAGGALAVFRHIKQFTQNVRLLSLSGTEPWIDEELSKYVDAAQDGVLRSEQFTTVVKQRFVEPQVAGKELSKLFSTNFIDAQHPGSTLQRQLCDRIDEELDGCDLVMAMDFGHGVLTNSVRERVQEKAPFLAVNCQTNSNNHGFNVINRQYHRADSFSLDQTEMHLAAGRRYIDYGEELSELQAHLSADYAWLTRGSVETIGLGSRGEQCACPPFEENVVDTVGAGDAFCAIASLAAARGLPLELATFLGQLAGAQAVQIVGNRDAIEKARFIKAGQTMLSF